MDKRSKLEVLAETSQSFYTEIGRLCTWIMNKDWIKRITRALLSALGGRCGLRAIGL